MKEETFAILVYTLNTTLYHTNYVPSNLQLRLTETKRAGTRKNLGNNLGILNKTLFTIYPSTSTDMYAN